MDVVQTFDMIRWILCAVAAALLRGVTPVFMRAGAKRSDPSLAAALFGTVLLAVSFAPVVIGGEWAALTAVVNGRSLPFLAVSGLLAAFGYLCLFTALTGAPVSRTLPILNLSSVLLALCGFLLFGERPGIWRLCCLVLILLGTVLMESRAERSASASWLLYAFLALLSFTGLSLLYAQHLAGLMSEAVALPLRTAVACLLLWAFTFARGKQRTLRGMGLKAWLMLPLSAVAIGLARTLDLIGRSFGDWSWLSPISCLGFASMLLFARIFLKEKLPGSAIFGMLLVLLGTFAILMGW